MMSQDLEGEMDIPTDEEAPEEIDSEDLESLSDMEDYLIQDTDSILIVAENEKEDEHSVQMQIYDSLEGNLFVHHCFPVPEIPLTLEFIGGSRCFISVGMMSPEIEIWNLQVIDVLEPSIVCAGDEGHTGPVTGLSWVQHHDTSLLSCSSDGSVKLWDITVSSKCERTLRHHKEDSKVQDIAWNPSESFIGLSGGSDQVLAMFDIRDAKKTISTLTLGEIEQIQWNPHNPAVVAVVLDSGAVHFFDVRSFSKSLASFQPHEESTVISFNPGHPNSIATAAFDETVKLWKIDGTEFKMVCSREMKIGAVLDLQYLPESKWILAAGGSEGLVAIWDTEENDAACQAFQ